MSPSPSSRTDGADAVAAFMHRLARSPAPRAHAVDPAILIRRAPLLARLDRVRTGERRVVVLTAVLELATLAGSVLVLQSALRGAPFVQLRGALGAGFEHLGTWGLPALAVIAAALLLAASSAAAAASR